MMIYHRTGNHIILLSRIWVYLGCYYNVNGYRVGFRVGNRTVRLGGKFPYIDVAYEGSE